MITVVEKAYPDMAGKIKYQNVGSAGTEAMEQYLIDRGLELEELSETKTGGAF